MTFLICPEIALGCLPSLARRSIFVALASNFVLVIYYPEQYSIYVTIMCSSHGIDCPFICFFLTKWWSLLQVLESLVFSGSWFWLKLALWSHHGQNNTQISLFLPLMNKHDSFWYICGQILIWESVATLCLSNGSDKIGDIFSSLLFGVESSVSFCFFPYLSNFFQSILNVCTSTLIFNLGIVSKRVLMECRMYTLVISY